VFVVEHRDGASARFKDADDLLEKLVAWVKDLTLFVSRIAPVFSYDQNAIDGQLRSAQRQGFGDRRMNPDAVPTFALAAEIALGKLIDVKRNQIHLRTMVLSVPAVTFEKAIDEMLRVGVFADLGSNDRDFFPAALGRE
jgi:hypothetical protein